MELHLLAPGAWVYTWNSHQLNHILDHLHAWVIPLTPSFKAESRSHLPHEDSPDH